MWNYYIEKTKEENEKELKELNNEKRIFTFFHNFSNVAIISLVIRMLVTGGQVTPVTGIIVFLLFGIGAKFLLIAINDKTNKVKKENNWLRLFEILEKNPLKY